MEFMSSEFFFETKLKEMIDVGAGDRYSAIKWMSKLYQYLLQDNDTDYVIFNMLFDNDLPIKYFEEFDLILDKL